jgi:ubiquinone/menaquinone biosynthesis C-methylase UbiE
MDARPQALRHYERLADRFDANWAYSPEFVAWMSAEIVRRLNPKPGDRVADIGCGTGLYACALADQGRSGPQDADQDQLSGGGQHAHTGFGRQVQRPQQALSA